MDLATEQRITKVLPLLNEKQRRLYLAAESESLGHGGIKKVSDLTGVSKSTIIAGKKETTLNQDYDHTLLRKSGRDRKSAVASQKGIREAIEQLRRVIIISIHRK